MDKRRLLLIVVCSFACAYVLHVASIRLHLAAGIDGNATTPADSVSSASRSLRPNYPYSVIPGGAYSPKELESAIRRDHLVSDHYSDFDLKSARLVSLTEDRLQYVSYRLKNRVYWTRNKLRIPKGEVLLTDGHNFARTRCGNRLSSQPKPQTSAEQPSVRVLSLPPFTPALLKRGDLKLMPPPPADDLATGGPVLPFDLPRLAPYLPGEGGGVTPATQQTWPIQPGSAGLGVLGGGPPLGPAYLPGFPSAPISSPTSPSSPVTPSAPGSPVAPSSPTAPGLPTLPVSPILPIAPVPPGTPTTPINEVPEPASLTLLAISLFGCFWLLTRVMRANKRVGN